MVLLLFFSTVALAQDKKFTYSQFDLSFALKGNPDRNKDNTYSDEKESWFLPDGIGIKLGYGIHYNKWVGLGIHSGLNWEWTDQLVVTPVFANFRLSPKISDETRITLQLGLGKAIALGRGSLTGDYKKISLGLENSDNILIFIEINHYELPLKNKRDSGNISLGISLIHF